MRRTFRIVPWRDERELQAAGKALLSVLDATNEPLNQANNDLQESSHSLEMRPEDAFAMISVWKSRMEGLPHAIESTAALAQVYWRDSQRRALRLQGLSTFGMSVTELRLAYSAAIVRCINGFADILQQQRAMAASVSNLCGQLGIPSWVVDTRHESAHNALPNLEVLRLSASTLLEFMKSEYWIPRCPEWNYPKDEGPRDSSSVDADTTIADSGERKGLHSKTHHPIDFLVEYKACSLNWAKTRGMTIDDNPTKGYKNRKKKALSGPPKTTILPYDPLFGEYGTLGSSSDEDDDNDADDNSNVESKLDRPAINSICGSSVGTSKNRFILLDISTKKKKKSKDKKKQKKSIPKDIKKKKGEKSPTDCAKLFVQSVSSVREGFAVATQYLIWGGVGGIAMGQGELISLSDDAFPTTPDGVTLCWQLYSPLVHVLSRTWPGFAANMITNLVECVLSIEENMCSSESIPDEHDQGEESNRKLYFLFAWIRLLISQRFVSALDQNLSAKSISIKNDNPLELPLAQLNHLDCLGYPLNSLFDRCRRFNASLSNSNDLGAESNSIDPLGETSRSLIRSFGTILGERKTVNFGYAETLPTQQGNHATNSPSPSERSEEKHDDTTPSTMGDISSSAMSLDEMEKMLMLGDNNNGNEPETKTEPSTSRDDDNSPTEQSDRNTHDKEQPLLRRPAWIKCERWDACSIGSLPGFTF